MRETKPSRGPNVAHKLRARPHAIYHAEQVLQSMHRKF